MARGMFRDGRGRPTFDTKVEFVPVNRIAADRSGGYGSRVTEAVWGAWSAPVSDTDRDPGIGFRRYLPPSDNGWSCTEFGPRAWAVEGDTRVAMQASDDANFLVKTRPASETGDWRDSGTADAAYLIADANRPRGSFPRIVQWTDDATANLPTYTPFGSDGRFAILVDTDEGQTLLTGRGITDDCLVWTRTYTPADPAVANRTFLADVKDVAGRESAIDGAVVAARTKSLIFAYASLKPLLDAEGAGLAKSWKIRIGTRDLDILSILDDWAPNRYVRIVAEERA